MKANEFVKKFGLDEAREQIKKPTGIYGAAFDYQFMDELKRLVESHDLVEKHGGLLESKIYVECCDDAELSKAIADVESCQ